jgi:hypothetical protein|tara:strand:- start:891 stop:1100 length:210 start_codon:yes stop_codon:yes gene_type:complete
MSILEAMKVMIDGGAVTHASLPKKGLYACDFIQWTEKGIVDHEGFQRSMLWYNIMKDLETYNKNWIKVK